MPVCDRHDALNDMVNQNHDTLATLKTQGEVQGVQLKNVVDDMNEIKGIIKYFAITVIGMLGGFFIWFVQNSPN